MTQQYKLYLIFSPVNICCSSMSQKDVVGHDIRFGRGVPPSAKEMEEDGAAARREEPRVVALDRECVRLIECDPVLHPVPKCPEACLCIVYKVLSEKWQ